MKRILSFIIILVLLFSLPFSAPVNAAEQAAAQTGATANKKSIAVKSVKLNKSKISLYTGKTYTLKATLFPSNATNKKVTWTTSNKAFATVSAKGVVTAKKTGTVTIKAKTANGKTASCKVTVLKSVAVKSVKLNKSKVSLNIGKKYTLKATLSPSTATNKKVTWSTSNKAVATVSAKGVVTAKKAGTATVKVKTANGKTASCKVTVVKPTVAVTSVKLSRSSLSVYPGASCTLKATVSPSNATNKTVTWSSSNTAVATVSKGTVTAKKAGTATITAKTNNGKSASCKVTVKKADFGANFDTVWNAVYSAGENGAWHQPYGRIKYIQKKYITSYNMEAKVEIHAAPGNETSKFIQFRFWLPVDTYHKYYAEIYYHYDDCIGSGDGLSQSYCGVKDSQYTKNNSYIAEADLKLKDRSYHGGTDSFTYIKRTWASNYLPLDSPFTEKDWIGDLFEVAMSYWDDTIKNEANITMQDIGFVNYFD